jgi:hypothetical protein
MAAGFTIAALFHCAGLASPALSRISHAPTYPPLRHVVFILIDGVAAFLFWSPPRWFIWPYVLLTVQVLQGHGARAWDTWSQAQKVNWIDVITVMGTLLGLTLLAMERKHAGGKTRERAEVAGVTGRRRGAPGRR